MNSQEAAVLPSSMSVVKDHDSCRAFGRAQPRVSPEAERRPVTAPAEISMTVGPKDVEELERLLRCEEGFDHLRANKRGDSITICSSSSGGADQQKHARLTKLSPATWGLSFPHHSGRWERTPFVGPMDELVATLVHDFSFHLEPW